MSLNGSPLRTAGYNSILARQPPVIAAAAVVSAAAEAGSITAKRHRFVVRIHLTPGGAKAFNSAGQRDLQQYVAVCDGDLIAIFGLGGGADARPFDGSFVLPLAPPASTMAEAEAVAARIRAVVR